MSTREVKILRQSLRPGDGLLLILFLGLALGSFWVGDLLNARGKNTANLSAIIMINNHKITAKELTDVSTFNIQGALGAMTLQIENNRIRVRHSTCPNQVCVRQGAAQRPGEMLVCVPNRVVILIEGYAPPLEGAPQESRGDAVTH